MRACVRACVRTCVRACVGPRVTMLSKNQSSVTCLNQTRSTTTLSMSSNFPLP